MSTGANRGLVFVIVDLVVGLVVFVVDMVVSLWLSC